MFTRELHRMARPCHAAYSNRAACHTHLGAFATAIEDAARCIALEPAWVKGYLRKGSPRKGCAELRTEQFAQERPGLPGNKLNSLVRGPRRKPGASSYRLARISLSYLAT